MNDHPKFHFILFVFVILSWGIAWPISKMGLLYLSPTWYVTLRLIIGTLTMMLIVVATKNFVLPNFKDLPIIVVVGLLQIALYILFTNVGLAYLPAGHSSLLAYTTPLWIMPIATLFFNEKMDNKRWISFILGMSGLLLLLSPWNFNWSNAEVFFGTIALLLASLCWAISILCVRYMQWRKSPIELIPWQLLLATIPISLITWIKEPSVIIHWNTTLIVSLIYTGIFVTGFSYWAGVIVNKALPTTILSLGLLNVPVISILLSAIFMNEHINLTTLMAMLLISLSCFFNLT